MRDKRPNRQPSGPGRSGKRARGQASPASATEPTPTPTRRDPARPVTARGASSLRKAAARLQKGPGALGLTRRALVFFGVLAILGLSFAGSLRVWMVQASELNEARTQIEQRTAQATRLESELARWQDSAYVKAQARTRLGWVSPGEVGYRVVDADGHVLQGSNEIEGIGKAAPNGLEARWWDRLEATLRTADEPPPVLG